MRIKLVIEYDGTDYCGWQIQDNGITVQQKIEEAIFSLTGEKATVTASGRTDAGVHAVGQVAHFDTNSTVPPEKFAPALNALLPKDIKILNSGLAENDFHARYSAKKKTYEYRMYVSPVELPLSERYAVRINEGVDAGLMREGAKYLVGVHDFKCFLAANSSVKDTVREIYSADIIESGKEIIFRITGNGFLYNMVRIIVGTLIDIGEKRKETDAIRKLIEGKDRRLSGKTAPAKGLTLVKVEYE